MIVITTEYNNELSRKTERKRNAFLGKYFTKYPCGNKFHRCRVTINFDNTSQTGNQRC